jgi:hypothetical protein
MPGLIQLVIGAQNAGALSGLKQVEGQLQAFAQRAAGALGAAFGAGAIVEFTRRAIDAADAIGKLAQKTGTAIQALSGLGAVAAADDVSLQELQVGLKGLSEWMVKTGQAGRDTTEVLLEQADLFARMPDGAQKVSLAMDRFGRAGQNMIPFLNKGSEAIREQVQEAEEFGAVVGPGFAAQANQFNDNLHRIELIFRGLFNQLARDLLPELNKFLEWVIKVTKEFGLQQGVLGTLVDLYKVMATSLESVRVGFEGISIIINNTKDWGVSKLSSFFFGNKVVDLDKAKLQFELITMALKSAERMEKIRAIGTTKPEKPGTAAPAEADPALQFRYNYELKMLQLAEQQRLVKAAAGREDLSIRESQLLQLKRLQDLEIVLNDGLDLARDAYDKHIISELEYLQIELQVKQKINDIDAQRLTLGKEIDPLLRMMKGLRSLSEQWTNFGANVVDTTLRAMQTAIDGVTNSIMAAIEGTQSWGRAFYQAGRQIIASLISITLQYVAGKLAMMVIDAIYHKKSQAQASQTAALSGIAGIAKAGEQGGWVGVIIYLAVFAAAVAAIMGIVGAIAGFAEGGIIRGGEQLIRVNERGQEAILNAQALSNVGEGFVAALNAGLPIQQAAAVSPAAPSIKNNQQVNVLVYDDKTRLNEYLQSAEGTSVVVDLMRKNLHNITGRT